MKIKTKIPVLVPLSEVNVGETFFSLNAYYKVVKKSHFFIIAVMLDSSKSTDLFGDPWQYVFKPEKNVSIKI